MKKTERDFEFFMGKNSKNLQMQQFMAGRGDEVSPFDYVHANYYKVRDAVAKHKDSVCSYQ